MRSTGSVVSAIIVDIAYPTLTMHFRSKTVFLHATQDATIEDDSLELMEELEWSEDSQNLPSWVPDLPETALEKSI